MKSSPRHRTLDVRPLLASGIEPLPAIRAEVNSLAPDEGLILLSPFLPSPLVDLLRANGFRARPERLVDGTWRTTFDRDPS